ncbi:MAG TPA: hypothetical protein VJN18_35285 [Polyangiaceae bacterium]|nr:hypothetical protein [Polyangiaceae bacterium]
MPSPLRSAALFTLTSALLLGLLSPGCSQQGEGERCDNAQAGDSDCESGLICVRADRLLENITDRCCKPDGSYDDSRCAPNTGSGNTGGKAGSSAMSEGGAPDGGGGVPQGGGAAAGGALMEEPMGEAGAPSSAGMPSMSSDGGTPSGGMTSTPAGGQGGAG